MAMLAALFLLSASSAPAAAPPPAPQGRAIGIARVRILSPVRVRQSGAAPGDDRPDRLVTHQAKRRDGARVIDTY